MWTRSIGTGVLIAVLVLGALAVGPMTGTSAYFQRTQITGPHGLCTWSCIPWVQTTQADFQSDIGVNVSTSVLAGSVILGNQTIPFGSQTITFPSVYGMSGNGGTAFSMYNISNSTWVSLPVTPATVNSGGSLAYGRDGNIYATRGGGNNAFWRYNISTGSWTAMTNVPVNVFAGGSLAYGGDGSIYLLTGTTTFYRYDISSNAWTGRADVPLDVKTGGSLVWTENGNLSSIIANGGLDFYQYNISLNTWTQRADTPGNVNAGGAAAFTRNGNISAFLAGGTTTFWRYNISQNTWTTGLPATPASVNAGGALVYTDNGNLLAFRGGSTNAFWQYNLSSQTWTVLSNVPAAVGAGGSLAYVPRNVSVPLYTSVYVPYGNITSVVNNTGISGTTWYSLVWSNSTTTGVNITFRVRASDTSFLPNAASPSWVVAGWPSPVTTGLPTGRYFQWQANLTTTDLNKTPRLDDVSLCYA
jgi:hypothetical protein